MTASLRLDQMSDAVATILAADLKFFRRHPHRWHRLRFAGLCEVEEGQRFLGLTLPPPGVRAYCAVRRLARAHIHRTIGFALDTSEVDFDERTARAAYRILGPQDATTRPNPDELWCPPGPSAFNWRLAE